MAAEYVAVLQRRIVGKGSAEDEAASLRSQCAALRTANSALRSRAKELRQLGQIQALVATGPCDIKSNWGGIFFYGIHQVDMVLRLLGYDISHVQVAKGKGQNHTAQIAYANGTVATMNLVGGARAPFHLSAIGEKGRIDELIVSDDSSYLTGIRDFCRTFRTGKTDETEQTMLGPVAVLEGLEKSVASGKKVRVTI